ncbi:MMPL family transporter [Acidiphilium iwatense]|uniref:MMPL family transporter n=1 Tax=Acidiphilium iwatense TaxID=768198 RepID=A0ABS9DUQ0_9PROT|nr:MMPL family transporter [Acidiphilium iwatense]MCF3946455.1 MMPL family transporter [Acidiphilium iwatense]
MRRLIMTMVARSRRNAMAVIVAYLVAIGLGLAYAAAHLGIDTNTDHLFASSLPWRQEQIKFDKAFPQFGNLIVAVVRDRTPEGAAATAKVLAERVAADNVHFKDVKRPGTGRFYRRDGLLLLPQAQLAGLLNAIVSAQPFLGQLSADPSAAGLFKALDLMAVGVGAGQANLTPYTDQLKSFEAALDAAAAGHPRPLSWQSLITPGVTKEQGDVRFVLIHPVLDHGSLEPGGAATAALRRIAASLPEVKSGDASVSYTGQIPLSDEQFASLKQGMVLGLVVSVVLITLWLLLAVRSWRMILPILATLLAGLALTISFAGIAIGTLNLISVAFAILFVGLAVDFAIQFCVRMRDVRRRIDDPALALIGAAAEAGMQIALASIATACGFLAFVPTSFVGVAELGLIAGIGMIIAFFCTVTFLPALLALTRPRGEPERIGFPLGDWGDAALKRHGRPVLALFAILALAGIVSVGTLRFDANPLDTQNPNTEAMRTLKTLLGKSVTNPFYVDVLAKDLPAARNLAARFGKLPEVSQVISGATFIPEHQEAKLGMIQQTQQILAPSLLDEPPPALTPARLRTAAAKAAAEIAKVTDKLPKESPLLGIGQALGKLQSAPDAVLMAMNAALTKYLPGELARLNDALSAQRITAGNLPQDVKRDWFLPDGQVRLQVIPTAAAQTSPGLWKFVDAVHRVVPVVTGPAATTVATAKTILGAFREAASLAAVAIAIILMIVLRSARDSALVVITLALSAFLTALFAQLAGLSLNYANIIALPLLLGVGVSFNVYFVMNWRDGMKHLLGSATARAVLFSALTTGTAFGSLAASHDRGTASMGDVLLLSLAAVLIATFVFLPALLYSLSRRE